MEQEQNPSPPTESVSTEQIEQSYGPTVFSRVFVVRLPVSNEAMRESVTSMRWYAGLWGCSEDEAALKFIEQTRKEYPHYLILRRSS